MEALQSMLIALRNCDYDHIGDNTIRRAREELKNILRCDDFDLNELLKQFVEFEVETSIVFRGDC